MAPYPDGTSAAPAGRSTASMRPASRTGTATRAPRARKPAMSGSVGTSLPNERNVKTRPDARRLGQLEQPAGELLSAAGPVSLGDGVAGRAHAAPKRVLGRSQVRLGVRFGPS